VPAFFVDYIVFHEMLHQAIPARQSGSRRQHHGPEFRARERAYPDYEKAIAWERENIGMLLGKPRIRRAA
jgi:predicted metallopeptidase